MLNKLILRDDYEITDSIKQIPSIILLDAPENVKNTYTKNVYNLSISDYSINIKGFSRAVIIVSDFIKTDKYKIAILGKNSLFFTVCVYFMLNENLTLTDCIRHVSNAVHASVWKNILTYRQIQFINSLFEPVLINNQNDITIYGIRRIVNRNKTELEQNRKNLLLKNFVNIFLINRKKLKSSFE